MFVAMKIIPEGANAARELARPFSNPEPNHWEELEYTLVIESLLS
jgi:hypothetical protein